LIFHSICNQLWFFALFVSFQLLLMWKER
jgi:hypothetical protein